MARTANAARKQVKKDSSQINNSIQKKEKENVKPSSIPEKRPAKSLSVSLPTISQKPKPVTKRASSNILKEIKYYQSNIGFLIPRALIIRVVRQTLISIFKGRTAENLKFTAVSLNILHEAIENHIVCLLELSYMAARHAKRVTLFPTDIRLINRIKGSGLQ